MMLTTETTRLKDDEHATKNQERKKLAKRTRRSLAAFGLGGCTTYVTQPTPPSRKPQLQVLTRENETPAEPLDCAPVVVMFLDDEGHHLVIGPVKDILVQESMPQT